MKSVDILDTYFDQSGAYVVELRINRDDNPEYRFYFRGLPEKLYWMIENDKIYNFHQFRELESRRYKYERITSEPIKTGPSKAKEIRDALKENLYTRHMEEAVKFDTIEEATEAKETVADSIIKQINIGGQSFWSLGHDNFYLTKAGFELLKRLS